MRINIVAFLPIVILCLLSIYSVFDYSTSENSLFTSTIIGISLVVVNSIVYFFNQEKGFYITGIVALIGTLNIVAFTTQITSIYFGISSLEISIQPISFVILLLWISLFTYFFREKFEKK